MVSNAFVFPLSLDSGSCSLESTINQADISCLLLKIAQTTILFIIPVVQLNPAHFS